MAEFVPGVELGGALYHEAVAPRLGGAPAARISTRDWLVTPQQSLASVTAGAVYHDGLGQLEPVRQALAWYPRDLWLWQLAGQWRRIGQEEPFCGRADEVGDDLGRRVLVGRLARDVMRLCFLLERRYAPYSKWLGTAFGRLEAAGTVGPLLAAAMAADRWPAAEEALVAAYQEVATRHNRLGLTEPLDPAPRQFFDRPWLVLDADRFAVACLDAMADRRLASLQPIGAIDQFVDSPPTCSASAPPCAARSGGCTTRPGPPVRAWRRSGAGWRHGS